MRAATRVGYEPIPGYKLRKRLGAGGYGEVWLADAPGGLQKAVKLVYGTVDQSHASSELKSLERIRQVHHPFLLSLERIEIVDKQVIIITELAESSVLDRFEQFRRKGDPGIPRAMLLDLLRDTAEALDFLAQKHSLQHLDVKPGNLLIIADRVKVADFGLVKDLHDQNQSLVSGLTPTYSAPEIFDGRPDFRSDQYSLAIVYMELLTGRLPFSGKTTGELARQHLNQPPNLEALPPADRLVVARALSKNPLDRFSTCRQFVEQLQKTRVAVLPQISGAPGNAGKSEKTELREGTETAGFMTSTATSLGGKGNFLQQMDLSSIANTWQTPRSMFIGLGGLGCTSILHLREQMHRDVDNRLSVDDHGWLAVDTTEDVLSRITDETEEGHLSAKDAIRLPVFRPSAYRDAAQELFLPLSRRWLYNIPKSLKTEGVRPIAILTFLDHYEALKAKVKNELEAVLQEQLQDEDSEEPLRIYVLTSLHGGTGSGLLCEMGLLVRQVMRELGHSHYRISAIATAAMTTNAGVANLPSAAAIACLSEMVYLMNDEPEIPPVFHTERALGSICGRPFEWVTLVDGGLHGDTSDAEAASRSLAQVAFVDSQTIVGAALAEERTQNRSLPLGWLRTGCADAIQVAPRLTQQGLARWCSEQALLQATRYMKGPRGRPKPSAPEEASSQSLPTVSGDLPLTAQASEDFTRRLLTELGAMENQNGQSGDSAANEGENPWDQWTRRLSNKPEVVEQQLQADLQTWKNAIATVVEMRVYNWKQIEQIQLNVIEGILDYCEHEKAALVELFKPHSNILGPADKLATSAVQYLRIYTEKCLQLLDRFQRQGRNLAGKFQSWCNSVSAERALNEATWDGNVSYLPSHLQMLSKRVNAVLSSTLHYEATQILEDAAAELIPLAGKAQPLVRENVNLQYIISLANNLVPRMATELGIDCSELLEEEVCEEDTDSIGGVSLKQLGEYHPSFSQNGGLLRRFAFAPAEQMEALLGSLKKLRLLNTTTVIPSTRSFGTHVACDASQMSLPQLISSLWRPESTTLQLAERLRTRVDIDWEPATNLLDLVAAGDSVPIVGNPLSIPLDGGTTPLPSDA